MTQPDVYTPAGAANYDSFAGFAATTQEEWEAQMAGQIAGHFFNLESAFSGVLFLIDQIPIIGPPLERAISEVLHIVQTLIDGLLGFIGGGGTGNPVEALVDQFGDWTGGLFGNILDQLGNLISAPTETPDWPYDWPVDWAVDITGNLFAVFLANVRRLFGGTVDLLEPAFDVVGAVTNFISDVLLQHDLIAALTDLRALAQTIIDAFDGIPIVGEPIHDFLQGVWDVIGGLFGTGTSNSGQISELRALITAPAGGTTWNDNFDPASDQLLSARGFTVTYSGTGSGQIWAGADRSRTYWDIVSGTRTAMCVHTATTHSTRLQYVGAVLENYRADANSPDTYLLARSDSTGANCIRVAIQGPYISIQSVIAGVVTTLVEGNKVWRNGSTFEFFVGDSVSDRNYVVKLNGSDFLTCDGTAEGDLSDLDGVYTGIGQQMGNNFLGFPIEPPHIGSATGSDRV